MLDVSTGYFAVGVAVPSYIELARVKIHAAFKGCLLRPVIHSAYRTLGIAFIEGILNIVAAYLGQDALRS